MLFPFSLSLCLSLSASLSFSLSLSLSLSTALDDEPPQTTGVVDELAPPVQIHSRASISEQEDHLPPLRPTRSLKSRTGAMGQRKMLVASYSDAADSAVSMVSWHVCDCAGHFFNTQFYYC